jgi:DNA-binding XRE family transcriptional regulator
MSALNRTAIFWDRKMDRKKAARILSDEHDRRFVELAALVLSRTNSPKEVFKDYLDKTVFCRNWRRIKRQMRINKWADTRIIFWGEIYRVLSSRLGKKAIKTSGPRIVDADPELKRLADFIRETRKKQGFTQAELGKISKISQQTISFVEKGYVNISIRTLKKIADALDLKISLTREQGVMS